MDKTFGELIGSLIYDLRVKAGMTQLDLAIESFEDETKVRRIVELENGQTPRPQAKTLGPICETLNISSETIAELKAKAAKQDQKSQKNLIELEQQVGKLSKALENLEVLNKDQLEALATRFEIPRAYDMSIEQLRTELNARAESYRSYRALIDAIDERTKGLGNLKAAAAEAAERLDFEEVEALLSRVDEVETEIAAQTKELRASNALMRGNAEQAFEILSAAADSFGSIDPITQSIRRIDYADMLYQYGRQFGGEGIVLATLMLKAALESFSQKDAPELWAFAQKKLAVALTDQIHLNSGSKGSELFKKAVCAYQNALTVFTKANYPELWASTQTSFAIALSVQAERTGGSEGVDMQQEAIIYYRGVLKVQSKTVHPTNWATTQINLGNALDRQALRTGEQKGVDLFQEAIATYREVLTVFTQIEDPVLWARTQKCLGQTLGNLAQRIQSLEGAALLDEAHTAFRDAQKVLTSAEHPLYWASLQNSLGNTLRKQGVLTNNVGLLKDAEAALRFALTVSLKAKFPVEWAMTTINLAIVAFFRARQPSCQQPRPHLEAALAHVEEALTVFNPTHMAPDHAKATALRDDLLKALSD